MLGATAAVYAFNRMSRSLWFLLNRMLINPCGVFYDDFPMFSPSEKAEMLIQLQVHFWIFLAGVMHDLGRKENPFQMSFEFLGASLT